VKRGAAAMRKCQQTSAALRIVKFFKKLQEDREDDRYRQEWEEELSEIHAVFLKGSGCYCHRY
jgi:hypothetical protein